MKQILVDSSRVDTVVLVVCQVHLLPRDLQISKFLTSGVRVLIFHPRSSSILTSDVKGTFWKLDLLVWHLIQTQNVMISSLSVLCRAGSGTCSAYLSASKRKLN